MTSPRPAGPTPAVREHYRDLYDGLPEGTSDRPVLAVLGNCQAESLRLLLDEDDITTVRLPALHELTAYDVAPLQALLARTDLLVSQPVGDDYRGLPVGTAQARAALPSGATHVLVPSLRYAGLHPHHLLVHPPGLDQPDPPVVPYHDVRTLVAAAWARAGRPAPPVPDLTPPMVLGVAADSVAELVRREQRHGTVVASDLLTRPTATLVRTINHPGNELLGAVAARLRARLGLAARTPTLTRPLLDRLHAPLQPAVVQAHDLAVPARDHWLVDGHELGTEEVARAHLAWYAERPALLDAALARSGPLRDRLGLEVPR